MNKKELDFLIERVTINLYNKIGINVNTKHNSSRSSRTIVDARIIFLKVILNFYDIVENHKTQYFADYLKTNRSNICILLNNIKNDNKIPKSLDNYINELTHIIDAEILLKNNTSLKNMLIQRKEVLESEILQIESLITSL
jgi:hypothetical protein